MASYFDEYAIAIVDDDTTEPCEWLPCEYGQCTATIRGHATREPALCSRHTVAGRIRERIEGLNLRRGLYLGLHATTLEVEYLAAANAAAVLLPIYVRALAMAEGRLHRRARPVKAPRP